MRGITFALAAAAVVLGAAGTASAHPIRALLCCHTHCCPQYVPVPVAPRANFGSFGAASYGFGGNFGFGAVNPGFGGATYGFGWVPMTFRSGGTGSGSVGPGFGGVDDDGFGMDPATIMLIAGIAKEVLGGIRENRAGGGRVLPRPGGTPTPSTPSTTIPSADLTLIHAKLDAILVAQAVHTSAILTSIKEKSDATNTKLDEVLTKLKEIKAQTDKIK